MGVIHSFNALKLSSYACCNLNIDGSTNKLRTVASFINIHITIFNLYYVTIGWGYTHLSQDFLMQI